MKMFIGVTDDKWYRFLATQQPEEVNFWQPGGKQSFKVLQPNELFLFKLHSPINQIVGGGFFVRHAFLPISLAWEAFGPSNGTPDFMQFRNSIHRYRKTDHRVEPDPTIGCIILGSPFFFPEEQWIPVPSNWSGNIVQGKSYNTDDPIGRALFHQVQQRLLSAPVTPDMVMDPYGPRYGSEQLITPRLGQGSFRVMVTEAYHRRCAITGEKTLPVLDAAHIRPYSLEGPHQVSNGLLLRRDVHALFDRGYITVDEDLHIEVSRRIKEDYGNGRDYYALHGKPLANVPDTVIDRPSKDYLLWHNQNVYLA